MQLTLTSSDNISFEVDRQIVKHSKVIEGLILDLNLDDSDSDPVAIPLNEVNGSTLRLIIDWLTLHKDDPVQEDEFDYSPSSSLSAVDRVFLKGMKQKAIFDLMLAARNLDVKGLLSATVKHVAYMLRECKKNPEIRKEFGIKSDFTEEEKKAIAEENNWFYA